MAQPKIVFENVNKIFYARRQRIEALKDISFKVMPGEFVSLVGPSGCGKSTIIRLLDDIIEPTSGNIYVDDYRFAKPIRDDVIRKMGFVFQHSNLLPWLTVRENMEFPLKIMKLKGPEWKAHVEDLIQRGRMQEFVNKYPSSLSGGMAQRVGVYRSMVYKPEILLMDEPFGALDEVLRDQLNMELLDLWQKQGQTIIFITHSIREAVFLSDRVLVMNTNPGRIVEEITVDLPRPRTLETFTNSHFMELTGRITDLIGEVNLKDIV